MTGKWLKLHNALLLATAFFLGAHLAYKLTFLFFENPVTRDVTAPPDLLPVAGNDKRLSEYQPIIARSPANAGPGITTGPDTIDTETLKNPGLELQLLGTVTTDGGEKFAVIEETVGGQQQLYREGSRVKKAVIKKISRGKVVLLVNDRKEILEVVKSRGIAEFKGAESGNNNEAGLTALMDAVSQGNMEETKLLLDRGADVNAMDSYGNTALILAARSGRSDLVRMLINSGADVNQKDNVGNTPLIDTARYAGESTLNVIEILIAEGADVRAKNIYNNTALMNAVRSGQTDVVELLLREGADINARAKNGQTALKLASDSLRKDVVAVLTDYGAMLQ
jgi:hypothetical protein